jgi:microcystin-dependent protein
MTISYAWIQGTSGDIPSYPARDDRRVIASLWDEGVLAGGKVTASGVDRVLTIPVGTKVVIDGDHAAGQGSYLVEVHTSVATVTIDAAPGSGSRIDLIGLLVRDLDEGGAAGNDVIIDKVTGTPHATTPTVPATPSSFLPLARVTIAAGQAVVTTGMVTDARVYTGPKEPIGTVKSFYGPSTAVPNGWEILAGQSWTSPTYDALADRLGLTLPATAPDSRGKVVRGVASAGMGSTVGGSFSTDTVTISSAQLPSHSHNMDHNHASHVTTDGAGAHVHSISDPTHAHGASQAGHSHGTSDGSNFVVATAVPGGSLSVIGGPGSVYQLGSTSVATPGITVNAAGTGISIVSAGGHNHTVDLPNHVQNTGTAGSGNSVTIVPAGIALYQIVRWKA